MTDTEFPGVSPEAVAAWQAHSWDRPQPTTPSLGRPQPTTPAPTAPASPDATRAADEIMRSVISDSSMPHSVRQAKISEAMALRQGRSAPSASTPTVPTPVVPNPQSPSTPFDSIAADYDMDGQTLRAVEDALSARDLGVTAAGIAQAASVGEKALAALEFAVADLEGPALDAHLSNARGQVERLYPTPEARRAAARDVREAAGIIFGARASEALSEIELAYAYDHRSHQQINMLARQILAKKS